MQFCIAQEKTTSTHLFFDLDVRSLGPGHKVSLDSLSALLGKDDSVTVKGYADFLGTSAYNLRLSTDRAKNVVEYLNSRGIEKAHISSKGEGAVSMPVNANPKTGVPEHRKVTVVVKKHIGQTPEVKANEPLQNAVGSKEDIYEMMKEGENLVWENLNFQPGRHFLLPESMPSLEKLLELLKQYPGLRIGIEGHICCERVQNDGHDWDTGENQLSVNRAKYIYEYLIQNGIDPGRLSYKGFGGKRPLVVYEITDADRAKNRRVEIKVLSK